MTKKIIIPFILVIMVSCSANSDTEKFINTYAQILVVREQHPDSTSGNSKVQSIITNNGYTQESFKNEFIKLSRDPQGFRIIMDSVQQRAKRSPH